MTGEDLFKKLIAELGEELAKNIERAKKENKEARKMQDCIIEKLTVGIALEHHLPTLDFVDKGMEHYIKLGVKISRNEMLTRITKEVARLEKIKDPAEILKVIMEKDKHAKEVSALIKSHMVPSVIIPFSKS